MYSSDFQGSEATLHEEVHVKSSEHHGMNAAQRGEEVKPHPLEQPLIVDKGPGEESQHALARAVRQPPASRVHDHEVMSVQATCYLLFGGYRGIMEKKMETI